MKHIVIGVTGSIAAYKAVDLVSQLSKIKELEIDVIMTKSACEFVQPLSFEALLKKKVYIDTFESQTGDINHISLAKKSDLLVMVPASANSIAKVVHGMADDLLTSTWIAATCKKMICPAMNVHMYENPITQHNLALAKSYGMQIVEPASGHLACGDTGKGKLADIYDILDEIMCTLHDKPLAGKKVLISAGPTKEAIDPVRFITNHSSGKMGYALARQAAAMGAEVTLVSGPTQLKTPLHVSRIDVTSSQEMAEAIFANSEQADYIIMSAAVADYRPTHVAEHKIKKNDNSFNIPLCRTTDILASLGQTKKSGQLLCGFAMETQNLLENARLKLTKKNCDMIVANSIASKGAGFQVDTNIATLITHDNICELPLMTKDDLAKKVLHTLMNMEDKK